MVELILNQTKNHSTTINLLAAFVEHGELDDVTHYLITTQEYETMKENEYVVACDWTIKLEDDKLFIISDYICSVIDLTVEAPFKIESRRI